MNQRIVSPWRRPPPVVLGTMGALLVAFVVSAIAYRFPAGRELYAALVLDPSKIISEWRVWTLLSYALVHDLGSPMHLLLNLLFFFFFGPDLELSWGRPRFALFLFLTALGGGLFVFIGWLLGLSSGPVVGASAIGYGLSVAWGLCYRDRTIYLMAVLPLRGIHLVYVTLALVFLDALSIGSVSAAAHLGGICVAAVLTLGLFRRNFLVNAWTWLLIKLRIKRPRLTVVPPPDRYNIQ